MNVDAILISDFATMQHGKVNIVGTFDMLTPPGYPFRIPIMCLTVMIHAHPSEAGSRHEARILLLNQTRTELARFQQTFEFPNQKGVPGLPLRHFCIWTLIAPEFQTPGAYAFEVYLDDTYHAGASFAAMPLAGG